MLCPESNVVGVVGRGNLCLRRRGDRRGYDDFTRKANQGRGNDAETQNPDQYLWAMQNTVLVGRDGKRHDHGSARRWNAEM